MDLHDDAHRRIEGTVIALAAGLALLASSLGGPALADHVEPIVLDEENPSCSDVIDDPDIIELKVEPPENGTFTDGTLVVTISNLTDDEVFDWSSNAGVDGVIVKSGNTDHNFYDYRPEEETADTNLSSADKHDISHISFCYDTEPNSTLDKAVRNVDDGTDFGDAVDADPGDAIEFRLTYNNTGTADATNVTISDQVPDNSTFLSCSDDCTTDGDGSPGTDIAWDVGTVAPDDPAVSVTFQVQLDDDFPKGTTTIDNVGSVSTDEEGTTESDEVTVDVAILPDSTLEKAVRNLDAGEAFRTDTTADPGDTVEFRITYNNTGNANATNVTITDAVVDRSTFVSCSDDCTVDGDGSPGTELTWDLGTVAPDDTPVSVTFQVELDSTFPNGTTVIANTATADTAEEDTSTESNEVTVSVSASPVSVLEKAVRNLDTNTSFDTTVSAEPGDTIEFRITYNNTGNANATNVTITDAVVDRSTFVSCSDDCTVDGDGGPGTELVWALGTVEPSDDPIAVTFRVVLDDTFPAGTTEIPNTATADSDEEPPTGSNEVGVIVSAEPDLHLRKDADRTTAGPGQSVTYTLAFWNDGDADATDTTVTETVPPGTSFVSCSDGCTVDGDTITWDVGTVPAHTSADDPAGTLTLTVQLETHGSCEVCNVATIDSPDDPDGPVASNEACFQVGPDPTGADTDGRGLGLGVTVADLGLDERFSEVNTSQSGIGVDNASTTFLEVGEEDTAGLASVDVLSSGSRSVVDEETSQASTTATAEVANVSLLDGLITARTVRGVATASATGASASTSTTGSTFEELTVNGVAFDEVSPNTRVDLPADLFGEGSHVVLYETETQTTTPDEGTLTGGTYAATTNVTMIHVFLTDALPGVPGDQPAEITVSQADAGASFPQTPLCEDERQQAVSGHAFVASATTEPSLAPVREGFVSIEPTGGDESQVLEAVSLDDGNVTASTADTRSQGELSATASTAESRATVAEVCLLPGDDGCLVGATGIETRVEATADASGAATSGTTTIANLTVAGTEVCTAAEIDDLCRPAPNTTIELDGLGFVVLNEQIPGAGGADHGSLTVRAIHLVVTVPDNPLGLPTGYEVVVAESHAGATFAEA